MTRSCARRLPSPTGTSSRHCQERDASRMLSAIASWPESRSGTAPSGKRRIDSSCPHAAAARHAASKLGARTPRSRALMYSCENPARRAADAWVRPAVTRAIRSSLARRARTTRNRFRPTTAELALNPRTSESWSELLTGRCFAGSPHATRATRAERTVLQIYPRATGGASR